MSIAKLEPLSKKEMKKALAKPFRETKRKLKQGFGVAPIFYYVPRLYQFGQKDKDAIAKGLSLAFNPQDCQVLVAKVPGWSYRDISLVGDFEVGALLYKGLVVAVFFKRQVDKIEPDPTDPIPAGALENLNDVWARLDLYIKSPRQLVGSVAEELMLEKMKSQDLQHQLTATNALLLAAHKKISILEKTSASANKQGCKTSTINKFTSKRKK